MTLLLLLLLTAMPAHGTSSSPLDELTGSEICGLIDIELQEAVEFDLITAKEAAQISLRCWINYSALPPTGGYQA